MAIGYVGRLGMVRHRDAADESMMRASASIVRTLRAIVRDCFCSMRLVDDDEYRSARFMWIVSPQKAGHYPTRVGTRWATSRESMY